ncbi:peptide chain release factor N(5)-glutamine methyltransferase [Alkalitalea saponilacus]|uniref:peptide chain release factor N(5)-glutamine methyltransferase n=1 Tax=Alkalitalea saponilacus TaxID=889453 RepID=A0A1T5AGK0_9BACT|nr:peptide chain release factor N(5)-glutamine methyltransferase [Alkalitalea saponilacus]ASB48708.1 protein-(glutamine-N5) methyltransferase, release factor-specific [Alkalitalea saponilacus]SKB34094.1 release factor glutamine methyltransferase [Alkalitalea saponilacus]
MQTVNEFIALLQYKLNGITNQNEIRQFGFLLMNCLRGYSFTEFHTYKEEQLTDQEIIFLDSAILRLQNQEPIQHITGQTEFMGLIFRTDKRALIPRPETEELVHLIINDFSDQISNILDVGTGTGCIPISLKKNWPKANVETWDLSDDAISLAKENAELNHVEIIFSKTDVLTSPPVLRKYDLVVSNPPYVTNSEKKVMDNNVLNYEPHLALFVEDGEPLLFYDAISTLGAKALLPGGYIYFEINEKFGKEVCQLLDAKNYKKTIVIKDLSGKDRFVKAVWPG